MHVMNETGKMNQHGIRLALHIGIGALSAILVLGLSHLCISQNDQGRMNHLQISGVTTFSASKLVEIVRREKIEVYWVGPLPRMEYALIANQAGEATLIYVRQGTRLGAPSTDRLTIHTHGGSDINHQFQKNTVDMILIKKGSIVTIHDPVPGSALNYAKKAGVIKQIS